MADGITIEGLPPLRKILKEVGSLRPVKKGLGKGAVHLKGTIDVYPEESHRPVAQYWTAKQRRYFFWALKKGKIEVPYRRGQSEGSENLADKWTVRSGKGGLEWKVGNSASYGPLVQDRDKQSRYHKDTGWITTQTVVEDEKEAVNQIIKLTIDAALEGR